MKSSRIKFTLKRVRPLLGTYVEIELRAAAPAEKLNAWITQGFEAVYQVDRLMSVHRTQSDISRINRAEPETWVKVHPHTLAVLKASNSLYSKSKGIFDIRCGAATPHPNPLPLKGRGRGGPKGRPRVRGPVLIRRLSVRKTGPWTLDLGGIAKGFAVDQAVKRIQRASRGTGTSGVVNAGGDLRTWGDARAFAVRTDEPMGSSMRPLRIRRIAAATSSVRTERDGSPPLSSARHVCMPIGTLLHRAQTVTVLAGQCLWSDALTKVVMMGPKKVAAVCLAAHGAKALIFGAGGLVNEVMG